MPQIVLPGQQLGYSEEFLAGSSAFEQDGVIYAEVAGRLKDDAATHSIGVESRKTIRPVKAGDTVYGLIESLMDTIAIVRFYAMPQGGVTPVSHTDSAYLRVSEIMPGYVENIRDYLRTGDIIRARVLEVKPLGTYLTLKGREYGVLKAFCSRCRAEMLYDGSQFTCSKCFRRERRKTPE